MSPAKKLAIVIVLQFLVLFSVLAFKQYTVWTSETVLLKLQPADLRDFPRANDATVEYEISRLDRTSIAWDESAGTCCGMPVYVELQKQDDGLWKAIAAHDSHTHTVDGTVLIKGRAQGEYLYQGQTVSVYYGIEDVFVPEGSASQLPTGRDHTIAVEVKVDRFGNATPRHFVVDGQQVDLSRR
jgi:uncharacterized membrane-anchored protein